MLVLRCSGSHTHNVLNRIHSIATGENEHENGDLNGNWN
jgi:hypothetical protein